MSANPFGRGLLLGAHLAAGGVLTTQFIRKHLGVSKAQAKRYMHAAEAELPVSATVGANNRVELRLGAPG